MSVVENELIAAPDSLSLNRLLERCGLKVNRSTLFCHPMRHIEKGRLASVGEVR